MRVAREGRDPLGVRADGHDDQNLKPHTVPNRRRRRAGGTAPGDGSCEAVTTERADEDRLARS
jgi:hypothetical protein